MTRNLAIPADDSILTANVYQIPIAEIQAGDSPRLSDVYNTHVTLLAGCEAELPPIVVHRQTMHIIDGNHRLRAAGIRLTSVAHTDRTIAAKVGLSNKTAAAVRRRLGAESPLAKTRLGRDGRTYPVDDVEGRQRAANTFLLAF